MKLNNLRLQPILWNLVLAINLAIIILAPNYLITYFKSIPALSLANGTVEILIFIMFLVSFCNKKTLQILLTIFMIFELSQYCYYLTNNGVITTEVIKDFSSNFSNYYQNAAISLFKWSFYLFILVIIPYGFGIWIIPHIEGKKFKFDSAIIVVFILLLSLILTFQKTSNLPTLYNEIYAFAYYCADLAIEIFRIKK